MDILRDKPYVVAAAGATADATDQFELGLPHGSVLSTILFVWFVNLSLDNAKVQKSLFVDDTSLWNTAQCPFLTGARRAGSALRTALASLVAWCALWRMSFNLSKCVFTVSR